MVRNASAWYFHQRRKKGLLKIAQHTSRHRKNINYVTGRAYPLLHLFYMP